MVGGTDRQEDVVASGYRTGASEFRRGVGAAALVGTGVVHVFKTPEYLDAQLPLGLLFGLTFPIAVGLAIWLSLDDDRRAWTAGALLTTALASAFLISRTIGFPGLVAYGSLTHWMEGFPALSAEVGFLIMAMPPLLAPAPSSVERSAPQTHGVEPHAHLVRN
jgi:hypothetical protein